MDNFPLPGDKFESGEIVVASTYYCEDRSPVEVLVMRIDPTQPGSYYEVCVVGLTPGWPIMWTCGQAPNIVPATELYYASGGDY